MYCILSILFLSLSSLLPLLKMCVGDAQQKSECTIVKAKEHIIKKSKHKKLRSPCRHQSQVGRISCCSRIGADSASNSPHQKQTHNHLPSLHSSQTIISSPSKLATPIKSHSPGKPAISPLVNSARAKQEDLTAAPYITASRACMNWSRRRLSTLLAHSEDDSPHSNVVKCKRRLMFPSESCTGKNGRFQPPIAPPVPERYLPGSYVKPSQDVKVHCKSTC